MKHNLQRQIEFKTTSCSIILLPYIEHDVSERDLNLRRARMQIILPILTIYVSQV